MSDDANHAYVYSFENGKVQFKKTYTLPSDCKIQSYGFALTATHDADDAKSATLTLKGYALSDYCDLTLDPDKEIDKALLCSATQPEMMPPPVISIIKKFAGNRFYYPDFSLFVVPQPVATVVAGCDDKAVVKSKPNTAGP